MRLWLAIAALAWGLVAVPVQACGAAITLGKMFDAPPDELGAHAQPAAFEVIGGEDGWLTVRLEAALFENEATDIVRLRAPWWHSCMEVRQRRGTDHGAVSQYIDADGELQFFLHTYEFRDEGASLDKTRYAVGAPIPADRHWDLGFEREREEE